MANKKVIYTAVYGNSTLREPVVTLPGFDYVCFTDNPALRSDVYRTIHLPFTHPPRLAAKAPKMLPHIYLAPYHASLWVDNSIECMTPQLADFLLEHQHVPFALFATPDRTTVAAEVAFCIEHKKADWERLEHQEAAYRAHGFPDTVGLYKGGFLWRQHHHGRLTRLNERWFAHNTQLSTRDEVSLPYLFWSLRFERGTDFIVFGRNMSHNEFITVHDKLM